MENEKRNYVGKLVICPTPLGNLGDMTPRALEALRGADVVCAEDTRITGKLLAAFDIHVPVERLDEASISTRAASVVERVLAGENVAYCSDAGMPGVSDPGQRLIVVAREMGAQVEVLPGPTAVATAYAASGFTCPRFYFGGFFPRKAGERQQTLQGLRALDAVLVFYESPRRIDDALEVVSQHMPSRQVAVCRELTKLHEEIYVDSAPKAAAEFARRQAEGGVKGEIVLVIDAPAEEEQQADAEASLESARVRAGQLRAEGALSNKDIAATLKREFGISRNQAYDLAMG